MEAVVIRLSQVVDKVKCPRTAIAPRRIEPGIKAQHFTRADLQQGTVGLQSFEFGFILDARQLQAVNLRVLNQERFVRRPEHRIPEAQPPEVFARMMLSNRVTYPKRRPRQAPAHQRQEKRSHELNFSRASHE